MNMKLCLEHGPDLDSTQIILPPSLLQSGVSNQKQVDPRRVMTVCSLQMAMENEELMQEYFPNHVRMSSAEMKETEEENKQNRLKMGSNKFVKKKSQVLAVARAYRSPYTIFIILV